MLHQIVPFVMKHWVLVTAFVAVVIVIVMEEVRSQNAGGRRVTPLMATQLINREDAVVIDIRDANAFRQGHIVNAKNFSLVDLDHQQEKLVGYRDRPLILVDANGLKVLPVAVKLKAAGLDKVVILKGGMESWMADNMPVVK